MIPLKLFTHHKDGDFTYVQLEMDFANEDLDALFELIKIQRNKQITLLKAVGREA